ncbi:Chemotaxis protein PomA [bioreactor metagenome]|uniref:Chemotaxis protein PomA n=1 Tax=bioreactor metagenome TaxID=1076179 RepID=A0A644WIK5_9ZZZZ
MNLFTLLSMVLGFTCVVISIATSGNLSDFFDLSSIFIVIGGVVCATCASFSRERMNSLLQALKIAFKKSKINLTDDIDKIVEIANVARRNGLLALEELTNEMDEPFLKKGIMLVVDGSDPELIRSIMETELSVIKQRHADNRFILDSMAAYAPAFGMIGTLIGLINMLTSLDDMSTLGPNMSVALITTFYGSMLANLVFNPLSKRLKAVGNLEYLRKELILEGIMAIQNGENPRVIREKLSAFLPNSQQQSRETPNTAEIKAGSH